MDPRTCTHCGRQLTGRADQRYCSPRCRVAAKRERDDPRANVRRRPLVDDARAVSLDLDKVTTRLERIAGDDRFKRKRARDEVSFKLYGTLERSIASAQQVLDQLEHPRNIEP